MPGTRRHGRLHLAAPAARLRAPGRDCREFALRLFAHDVDRARVNAAGVTVERYDLALAQRLAADAAAALGEVDREFAATDQAHLAHLPRHHCRMRRAAAAR